jgi:hypothetical protein
LGWVLARGDGDRVRIWSWWLQFALQNKVDYGQLNNTFDQNYDPAGMVDARQKGLSAALKQQAAGMGITGAYDASINSSLNARQTLIDKSIAAYRPEAYQQQQALSQNSNQLLQSIMEANTAAEKEIIGTGRSV